MDSKEFERLLNENSDAKYEVVRLATSVREYDDKATIDKMLEEDPEADVSSVSKKQLWTALAEYKVGNSDSVFVRKTKFSESEESAMRKLVWLIQNDDITLY